MRFQIYGNPLELSAELPGGGPLTFEGQDLNYGASVTLLQPVYTGGRIIEAIRLAESQTLVAEAEPRSYCTHPYVIRSTYSIGRP